MARRVKVQPSLASRSPSGSTGAALGARVSEAGGA
jgi:hypothetical protein